MLLLLLLRRAGDYVSDLLRVLVAAALAGIVVAADRRGGSSDRGSSPWGQLIRHTLGAVSSISYAFGGTLHRVTSAPLQSNAQYVAHKNPAPSIRLDGLW